MHANIGAVKWRQGQEKDVAILVDHEDGIGLSPTGQVIKIRFLEIAVDLVRADGLREENDGPIEVFSKSFAACAVFVKWNVLSRQQAGERRAEDGQDREKPHIKSLAQVWRARSLRGSIPFRPSCNSSRRR